MKRISYFLVLALICQTSFSQNLVGEWSQWYDLKDNSSTYPQAQISFNLPACDYKNMTLIGNSYYRVKSLLTGKTGTLTFKFSYTGCDGKVLIKNASVDVSIPDIQVANADVFFGSQIVSPGYDCNYNDPDKAQAENLKPTLDDAQNTFSSTYTSYSNKLNTIQDPQTKEEYQDSLNELQGEFNHTYDVAEQYYRQGAGDKMQEQINYLQTIKARLDLNLNLLHDVRLIESTPQQQAAIIKNTQQNTQSNNNTALQSQTQQDINNAQNSNNDAIQNANALGHAQINAMRPGGSTVQQRAEIQQVQQQQNAQSSQAIASGVTSLVGTISDIFAQKQAEKEQRAKDQEQAEAFHQKVVEEEQQNAAIAAQRQDEEDQKMREDSIQKDNVINQVLGVYANKRLTDWASISDESIATIYCVAILAEKTIEGFPETFNNGYDFFPLIVISRNSDGSWPFYKHIIQMLQKTSGDEYSQYTYPVLVGYFTNEEDAQKAALAIRANRSSIQGILAFHDNYTPINYTEYNTPINYTEYRDSIELVKNKDGIFTTDKTNHGYNITLQTSNYQSGEVYLAYHMGKNLDVEDSTFINNDGIAVFSADKRLPGGMYSIVFPGKTLSLDFLINANQVITIKTNTTDLLNKTVITGSNENSLFLEYLRYIAPIGKLLTAERVAYSKAKTQADLTLHADNYNNYNKELNDYRDSIIQNQPTSMMAVLLKAMKDPKILIPKPATHQDSLDNYNYYKLHYWDGVTFTDERIIRTPFFLSKLETYYRQVIILNADSIIQESDHQLLLAKNCPEMFKFLLNWFTDEYFTPKYVGFDAIFIHLYENYHKNGVCKWLSDDQEQVISRQYRHLKFH